MLARLLLALLVAAGLVGLDASFRPELDESVTLRWLRQAAQHPWRTCGAVWLLLLAVRPPHVRRRPELDGAVVEQALDEGLP